jgi:c-di-GMP-binding flagellar brake protein YcgR
MMSGGLERRKFSRLNILVDVSYAKKDSLSSDNLTLTKNISKGGICFVGYEKLNESDVIDLKIFLPGEKLPIAATAKVVWVKEFVIGDPSRGVRYDVGVEFIAIQEGNIKKFDNYMQSHLGV